MSSLCCCSKGTLVHFDVGTKRPYFRLPMGSAHFITVLLLSVTFSWAPGDAIAGLHGI